MSIGTYSERIEAIDLFFFFLKVEAIDLVWLSIERSHHHFDRCSPNIYYNHLYVDF